MTITLLNLFYLLSFHWIGDFIFQTDWQAKNKSKNWTALFRHTISYISVFSLLFVAFEWDKVVLWMLINWFLHLITDAVTSRINTYLWNKQDVHNFFVSVGLDQLIHFITLISTFVWLLE